jgi:hypothetical protein
VWVGSLAHQKLLDNRMRRAGSSSLAETQEADMRSQQRVARTRIIVIVAVAMAATDSGFAQYNSTKSQASPMSQVTEVDQASLGAFSPSRGSDLSYLSPPPMNQPAPQSLAPQSYGFDSEPWTWQILPTGLLYRPYLAGAREARLASQWVYDKEQGWLWDVALGGKAGVIRFGSPSESSPEGFQLDLEGVALPRLDWDTREVLTTDYHFGFPLTFRKGQWEAKFGYYHYCSHLSDEFVLSHPGVNRTPYTRDSLVLGIGWRPLPPVRIYSEADWAFNTNGPPKPWQFQVGAEYSSTEPTSWLGSPFLAVNGRLREDVDFGGSLVAEAGWQWRGQNGQLLRLGAMYVNGPSDQGQYPQRYDNLVGMGLWYDF